MITIEGLYKSFGRKEVLKGIDLSIGQGSVTAVVGPNGSGKTTLIKSILGIVVPQKGKIKIDEMNIRGTCEYRNEIGYLPQIARFPENLKVRELVHMVSDIREKNTDNNDLIKKFSLDQFMDTPLRQLSGGTRQKVNILLAFMFNSRYYILDEPTTGLDPVSLLTFKEMMKNEKNNGKAILLTTHIIDLVDEIADEVVFILDGKVYFKGPIEELRGKDRARGLEKAIAGILKENGHV